MCKIGIVHTVETKPGIYKPVTEERRYRANLVQMERKNMNSSETTNKDFVLNIVISILSDQFLSVNLPFMAYVEYMGAKWSITSVTPNHHRIEIKTGGLYNGSVKK